MGTVMIGANFDALRRSIFKLLICFFELELLSLWFVSWAVHLIRVNRPIYLCQAGSCVSDLALDSSWKMLPFSRLAPHIEYTFLASIFIGYCSPLILIQRWLTDPDVFNVILYQLQLRSNHLPEELIRVSIPKLAGVYDLNVACFRIG